MVEGGKNIAIPNTGDFTITDHAHGQIAERLQIPASYYRRMFEQAPSLFENNVNHWFASMPKRHMVRTIGPNARAVLSDAYQRIDNDEVARTVLPILADIPGLQVVSCEVTEQKMYIKVVTDKVAGEVTKGDVVQAGLSISNSEIGMGAISIQPLVYRLVCTNGMILPDSCLHQRHVGARADKSESVYKMLSQEALLADDRAILLKVRDITRASVTQVVFDKTVDKLRAAAGQPITGRSEAVVEKLTKKMAFRQEEADDILEHLLRDGDLSKWGLVNAITRTAQDSSSYDRATELEAAGGKVLNLQPVEWRDLSMAA